MRFIIRIGIVFFFSFLFLLYPKASLALSYSLIAPSGQLTRGQEIQFTVTIDTGGAPITSSQIGLSYQTQYLQYIGTTPGEAMTQLNSQDIGNGKIILNGTNPAGYTGKGNLAYVTFKIVAEAPGSTELCTLFNPQVTPTAAAPTSGPIPTTVLPTRLPKSGVTANVSMPVIGGILILASVVLFSYRESSRRSKNNRAS